METLVNQSFDDLWESIVQQLPYILLGLAYLAICILVARGLRAFIRKRLLKNSNRRLMINFISRLIFWAFTILGIILFLNQVGLGKAANGLLAGAGVSALIFGFAFKDIGENFLAGFFLAFSRPFHIGNVIQLDDLKGVVKQMNFRNTHIRTYDGKDIFLPNAMLIKQPLINYTRDDLLRFNFQLGIDYDQKVPQALNAIRTCLDKESRIEHEGGLHPFVELVEFSASTINVKIYYWIRVSELNIEIPDLKTSIMHNVYSVLIENGINLPSDVVEMKMYPASEPFLFKMAESRDSDVEQ